MEHLRAFITAWLSIYLLMLKCVWRRVSFHHTVCFCVKCAVTVAGLTALHHSHCSLIDPSPVVLHLLPEILQDEHLHFSLFSCCRPPVLSPIALPPLYFFILTLPYTLLFPPPSMSTNYGGVVVKGSTKTSSGPPTDPVPPFTEPSFLAISPVLVFWLGPRPLRHKGLIMGYNWLGCVTHLWDGPLPVPPCPPLLFVFGLLLKNWASNLVTGQRGKQSVSVCLSLSLKEILSFWPVYLSSVALQCLFCSKILKPFQGSIIQ